MWKDIKKHEYIVGCATCNKVFLSPSYQPKILWYILAAEHWIQNPTHEVILYEVNIDGKPEMICWSVGWRKIGIVNVLKEIQHLKTLEQREF